MSEAKHTPGPWIFDKKCKESPFYVDDATGRTICQTVAVVTLNPRPKAEEVANAQLIASAPELLEVLKDCVNGLGCQPGYVKGLTLDRAQVIIAKAEGRA